MRVIREPPSDKTAVLFGGGGVGGGFLFVCGVFAHQNAPSIGRTVTAPSGPIPHHPTNTWRGHALCPMVAASGVSVPSASDGTAWDRPACPPTPTCTFWGVCSLRQWRDNLKQADLPTCSYLLGCSLSQWRDNLRQADLPTCSYLLECLFPPPVTGQPETGRPAHL